MAPPDASRAPSRRPQISREYLDGHRRRRLVDALAELLHEFGRPGTSVTNIVRLAGTARNTFYELFGSSEDCIAYGGSLALGEYFVSLDAEDGGGEWLLEAERALTGFYETVAAEPILAELLLVHCAACKLEAGREAGRSAEGRFVPLLQRGRDTASSRYGRSLPPLTEEYFSTTIVTLAARRILEGRPEALPGEARGMVGLVGGFFLGAAQADQLLGSGTPEHVVS